MWLSLKLFFCILQKFIKRLNYMLRQLEFTELKSILGRYGRSRVDLEISSRVSILPIPLSVWTWPVGSYLWSSVSLTVD